MADTDEQEDRVAEQDATDNGAASNPDAAVLAQAVDPEAVEKVLRSERAAAKAANRRAEQLAAKITEYENRDKTDLERATSKAEEAAAELAQYKHRALAQAAAIDAGIADWWERLRGADEDELRADAKKLAKRVGQQQSPVPDLGAGPRSGSKPTQTGSMAFSNYLREKARS